MMNNKSVQTYFDCGYSKIRAGVFTGNEKKDVFYNERKLSLNNPNSHKEIQNIITSLEKETNRYIDNINLMIDSSKILSIGLSISKKLDGNILKHSEIKFLIQEARQQVSKNYKNQNIIHIIINNYKINGIDYYDVENEIKCNLISIDILFICIPNDIIYSFKKIFSNFNILINQTICSCYAKSINYKNNLNISGKVSFIDIGFNKTSIISFYDKKVLSLETLPIGSNHITKDISKILKIDLENSENLKINFLKDQKILDMYNFSIETIENIIFSRIEEILKLSIRSIKSNAFKFDKFKIILIGEGSKILNNSYKNKISILNDVDFMEENTENICRSGFLLGMGLNKQEVVVVPKKQIKQGFFEKLFHLFR